MLAFLLLFHIFTHYSCFFLFSLMFRASSFSANFYTNEQVSLLHIICSIDIRIYTFISFFLYLWNYRIRLLRLKNSNGFSSLNLHNVLRSRKKTLCVSLPSFFFISSFNHSFTHFLIFSSIIYVYLHKNVYNYELNHGS